MTAIISSMLCVGIIPPPPVLCPRAFNPPAALGGMTVMLSGSNFSATVSNNIVYFGARSRQCDYGQSDQSDGHRAVRGDLCADHSHGGWIDRFRRGLLFLPTFVGNGQTVSASTFFGAAGPDGGLRQLSVGHRGF